MSIHKALLIAQMIQVHYAPLNASHRINVAPK